jgi:dihydrofolate synthase/folylpolyglutamate synthase
VFATSKDKDVAGMLEQLLPRFDEVVLTRYIKNPRAVPVEELVALANKLGKMHDHDRAATQIHAAETPDAAWRKARELGDEQSLLCVAGSFFLAAELRPRLLAEFATKSPQ